MATTIVTRASKGGRLSFTDMDNNLLNLQATADAAAVKTTVDAALALKADKTALFSGSYADLTGKPVNVSDFINDSGFQTGSQVTAAIHAVVGAAPAALDTLAEIATQLASDESAAAALTTTVSGKADKATTLAGYGITNAYTKTEVDSAISAATPTFSSLTGKPTTLSGYGITDAYTKTAVDSALVLKADKTYVDTHLASKEDIASLAAVAESGSYADLHNKPFIPSVVSDLTNDSGFQTATQVTSAISAASLASLHGSATNDFSVKGLTVNGDIMPAVSGVSNIGSATQKFAAIYTKEMHIDANTLYVDGVPVLGSSANTINITADVNQGMRIATTGSGVLVLDSQATTTIGTSGQNADVVIQTTGTGSLARITSATQVTLTAPTVAVVGNQTVSGSLVVSGDFTVSGVHTTVNSTSMTVEDNIITLNKGEQTDGITLGSAGIEIDRGALARQRMIFTQSAGKWQMGPAGAEINVASESYVDSAVSGKANTSSLAAVATSGSYADLSNKPTLFSGAYADLTGKPTIPTVPTAVSAFTNDSGYQTAAQVSTAIAGKANSATTLAGYGITDAYTKTAVDSSLSGKADKATTLAGYGITDAYTKTVIDSDLAAKADKATTLAGYGITDAYTKTAVDTSLAAKANTSSLATVATSGSYTDLTSKPTIPTVPTAVSAFTNDSNYQTGAQVTAAIQAVVGAAPAALDTLVEIATQLQSDESAAAALTTTVSTKAATTYVDAQDALKLNKLANGDLTSSTLTTSATTSGQVVDSFSATTFRSAKYVVSVTSSTSYQASEIMVIHDGTTVYMVESNEVHTGAVLATYDADISGGNVRLLVTPTNAATTFKAVRTSVNI